MHFAAASFAALGLGFPQPIDRGTVPPTHVHGVLETPESQPSDATVLLDLEPVRETSLNILHMARAEAIPLKGPRRALTIAAPPVPRHAPQPRQPEARREVRLRPALPPITEPVQPSPERPLSAAPSPDIRIDGPFDRIELSFRDPEAVSGWRRVRGAYREEASQLRSCLRAVCTDGAVAHLLAIAGSDGRHRQLERVNAFVNALPYRSDGGVDHWSPPLDTLRNGGDCEDSALLKMALLEALAIPRDTMAVAVGHTRGGQPHAVLLVELGGRHMVLDNRHGAVVEDTASDFVPRYSVGEGRRLVHVERRLAEPVRTAHAPVSQPGAETSSM